MGGEPSDGLGVFIVGGEPEDHLPDGTAREQSGSKTSSKVKDHVCLHSHLHFGSMC
jgi:hypothetical protein